jgi:hypothetical protein
MPEQQIAVYNQFRNAQDKYTYFLLAAVGGAVAFALRETATAALSWSQVPVGAAILCWGLSFYWGCQQLEVMTSSTYSNLELLKVNAGLHPDVGTHPQVIAAASEGIRDALKFNASLAGRYARRQFRLLILGTIFYIGWHIWEMWVRTPHALLK